MQCVNLHKVQMFERREYLLPNVRQGYTTEIATSVHITCTVQHLVMLHTKPILNARLADVIICYFIDSKHSIQGIKLCVNSTLK